MNSAIFHRMKRTLLLLMALFIAPAANAWEAGRVGPVCTLTHSERGSDIRLTYDPGGPLYTITWTIDGLWPMGTFGIRFDGAQPNLITTDRHVISDDGRSVNVADRGFGNVLDGLRFNETATAMIDGVAATVALADAAPAVEAFLACEQAPSA